MQPRRPSGVFWEPPGSRRSLVTLTGNMKLFPKCNGYDPFTLKSLISGTRLSLFAPQNWPWFQEFSVWWEENWNEPPFLTDFCFFFKAEISLNHRKSTHFRNALRFSHEGTWSMQTNKKGGTFRTTAALRRSNLHCLGLKNGDRRPRSQFRIKDQHRANPEFQYQL